MEFSHETQTHSQVHRHTKIYKNRLETKINLHSPTITYENNRNLHNLQQKTSRTDEHLQKPIETYTENTETYKSV